MRFPRRLLLLPSLLLALVLPPLAASAQAGSGHEEKVSPGTWPQRVYRWHYNPRQQPPWLDSTQARSMVLEAARQWETACGVRMDYRGETDLAAGAMDGTNVVGWRGLPRQMRGITLGRARAGQLRERDVAFDPRRTEFEREPRLLQKVIVHEFGHAIGLTHSASCSDVMTLAADCPRVPAAALPVTPTTNDVARCVALYGPP
jgi:hypothetical protein